MILDRRALLVAAPAVAASGVARAQGATAGRPVGPWIDATATGVVPDARDVQTEVLQGAIDTAAAHRGTLVLPPGTIRSGPLRLRTGSRIAGAGAGSRLALEGDGSLIEAAGTPDVALGDFALEGVGASDAPIVSLEGCERFALARLMTRGGGGDALALERCGGSVRECTISGAGEAGIVSLDATGLEIVHNVVEDCANNGIQVWRSAPGPDRTVVAHNRVRRIAAANGGSGEYGNAINVFRAHHVIVSANQIDECAYSAVRSNAGSDCQIVGNSCTGLGEVAIYAEYAFEGAVVSGNIVDGAAAGISITNFNEGGRLAVCSGNIVRNLRLRDDEDRRGYGISVEADTVVTGNVIEGAPMAGIVLGWGPHLRDVSATNNIVRGCGVGIAVSVADGAGAALISGNLIAGARNNAIQGYEWDQEVGRELAGGTPPIRPQLTISGNVTT